MNAVIVTEVVANRGLTCAFQAGGERLAIGRQDGNGHWILKLPDGRQELCIDFDAMRMLIIGRIPGGHACFERRRIEARGRLVAHVSA
jgi:hypothetical protein